MILRTAGRYQRDVFPAGDPSQVLPQPLWFWDKRSTILRAENAMHKIAGQSVHMKTINRPGLDWR